KLDSKEGVNDLYKIPKARERRRKDLGNVRYIKDEGGQTIVREEDIRKIWGEYFCSLFNESRPEGSKVRSLSPLLPQDCYYSRINQRGETRSVKMPDEWRLSEVIPIYKNKEDVQACGNYMGIKLLSHTMKLWERVNERRLRRETREKTKRLAYGFPRSLMDMKELRLSDDMTFDRNAWRDRIRTSRLVALRAGRSPFSLLLLCHSFCFALPFALPLVSAPVALS
ncbi:hypothetical protein Tco_1536094, partial [Tanacetum coccineum]